MTALDAASEQEGELGNESFYESKRVWGSGHTSSCQAAGCVLTRGHSHLPCSLPLARHCLPVVSVLNVHPIPNQTLSCPLYLCILHRAQLVTEKMLKGICFFPKQF